MTEPQKAQGSTADYCTKWPTEGHSTSIHMRGGALVSVRRCDGCGWIDFADLDEQVRAMQGGWARLERQAAQSGRPTDDLRRDLAAVVNRHSRENLSNTPDFLLAEFMLNALEAAELFTAERDRWYGIAPEPGWQRPTSGAQAVDDPAVHAAVYRLGEQREALHAAREIFLALDVGNDSGLAFAIGAGTSTNITMWMDRFSKLADPPMAVEVEEDDDVDDEPTTGEPGAGVSSGRWQPMSRMGVVGGAAHLDFAEDAARRARERASDE
jgi:hypothetical protein